MMENGKLKPIGKTFREKAAEARWAKDRTQRVHHAKRRPTAVVQTERIHRIEQRIDKLIVLRHLVANSPESCCKLRCLERDCLSDANLQRRLDHFFALEPSIRRAVKWTATMSRIGRFRERKHAEG